MIIDFIFQLIISFAQFAINLLPNFSGLPSGVSSAFDFLQPYFQTAYTIFPMDTLFQILLLIISIQLAVWSWDIFWWFYNKMPGKFT